MKRLMMWFVVCVEWFTDEIRSSCARTCTYVPRYSEYVEDICSIDMRWPASVSCQDLDSRQGLSLIWGVSDFVSDWDHLSGHSPLKHAFTLGFGG
jgi:hypothetical protein